jgi:hypothetical protein
VLGAGRWQIEAHGERSRDAGTHTTEVAAVLSYGVTQQADLQVEQPYVAEGAKGRGDASVSLKWRFFERDRLSLVVKPDIHEGRRWGVNFVAGYQAGKVELLGHAGYLRNRSTLGERESLRHASIAVLFAATQALKLAVDLSRDTDPDPDSRAALRELALGAVYALSDDVDLGLGVKKGLSDPAADRALLAGIKFRW